MRDMRRTRINVLATALGLILPILILAAVAGIRILALLPVVMSFWFLFYMPRWRRSGQTAGQEYLQRWQLRVRAARPGACTPVAAPPIPP